MEKKRPTLLANPAEFKRRLLLGYLPATVGSLMNAYKLIGYDRGRRYHYTETGAKIDTTIRAVANDIVAQLQTSTKLPAFSRSAI